MSSIATLLLLMAGTIAGPMPDGGVVGRQAGTGCIGQPDAAAITVCGRGQAGPSPRMPLRDDRFAAGEVVRHPSELPPAVDPGPPREPSRLMDTIVKTFKGVRSVLTGEDPDF